MVQHDIHHSDHKLVSFDRLRFHAKCTCDNVDFVRHNLAWFLVPASLQGTPFPIWRRIQVPENYSFWDLSVAIQNAMGWGGGHLHDFEIINPEYGEEEHIGMPDPNFDEFNTKPGHKTKISDYFIHKNTTALYVYDFGDDWRHTILYEGKFSREQGQSYPVCLAGKNACPPEDVGGIWGYEDFLKIISDPNHEEHESMLEWIGQEFNPHTFEPRDVFFSNPKEELEWTNI